MKKTIIAVIIIGIIIVAVLFGIKSCEPRKKTITSEQEEYSAFINANIEFTCELIKIPTLRENTIDSKTLLNEIYAKYKLPVSDDQAMLKILKKYENNSEIAAIIKSNTANCLQGGSPLFYKAN